MAPKSSDQKRPPKAEARAAGGGFETRLQRLEAVAAKLRDGAVPLDEAIALFEEGMKLSGALEKELSRVERRVQVLTADPGEGGAEPGMELFPELDEEESS